ncbi:MAG: acyl dehydratase [Actinobacteria bacterium]|nr:acyl dehydratase [Actinomycetota bacterium]
MSTTGTWSGRAPRELDDATIEQVRARIGIPVRYSPRSHNEVSSEDSFRHFALGYGDDNPLYTEPEYARRSSFRSSFGPPLYALTAGVARPVKWSEAEKAEMSGGDPLAGIGQYMCGERWVLLKPIRAGDAVWKSQALFSADLRPSNFGGGTGALVSHQVRWEDADGSPFAFRFLDFWHASREKSGEAAVNRSLERPAYSDADLERIDACYQSELVRGSEPRLVGDVEVGEELGPIAKGPLSITEIVAWHSGVGWGIFGGGASKVAYKNRSRIPKFYLKNELGFWDMAQRAHWDDEWAQRMGHPAAYDYGVMRSCWMVHLVNNWMGDDAWVWKVSASVRKFNYLGDSHFVSGVVREVDRAKNTVTIAASCLNQRGEVTADGEIVVILPTREGGTAVLPDFDPADIPEASAP